MSLCAIQILYYYKTLSLTTNSLEKQLRLCFHEVATITFLWLEWQTGQQCGHGFHACLIQISADSTQRLVRPGCTDDDQTSVQLNQVHLWSVIWTEFNAHSALNHTAATKIMTELRSGSNLNSVQAWSQLVQRGLSGSSNTVKAMWRTLYPCLAMETMHHGQVFFLGGGILLKV